MPSWRTQLAMHADLQQLLRRAGLMHVSPDAASLCSLSIAIDNWYGAKDKSWGVTNVSDDADDSDDDAADATDELPHPTFMLPARRALSFREELARFGVRDCVLSVER